MRIWCIRLFVSFHAARNCRKNMRLLKTTFGYKKGTSNEDGLNKNGLSKSAKMYLLGVILWLCALFFCGRRVRVECVPLARTKLYIYSFQYALKQNSWFFSMLETEKPSHSYAVAYSAFLSFALFQYTNCYSEIGSCITRFRAFHCIRHFVHMQKVQVKKEKCDFALLFFQ